MTKTKRKNYLHPRYLNNLVWYYLSHSGKTIKLCAEGYVRSVQLNKSQLKKVIEDMEIQQNEK